MLNALAQVAQPSSDLARSVAFYRDVLGGSHTATFDPPGAEEWMAFFRDPDGNILAFAEWRGP